MIFEGFLTESKAGSINTIFFISYAIGQLINGYLGDRLRADRLILIGTLLSGLCNLLMGVCPTYHLMPWIWAVNGYSLSMLWAPMLRLFANQMEPDDCTRYTVHMSSSCSVGAVGASLLCSLLVAVVGWRSAFFVSALCLLLPGLFWWISCPRILSVQKVPKSIASKPASTDSSFSAIFWTLPMLISMVIILIQGMLRDGVASWVPTMITTEFHTAPSLSILMSSLLPIITLVGPYAAHGVPKHWKLNEAATSFVFFTFTVLALFIIRISMQAPVGISVTAFAVVTASMEAVNMMFLSIMPLRYAAQGKTSTVSGLFNFITYVGSALSAYTAGLIVERYGWISAISVWLLMAGIAMLLCLLIRSRHKQA